MIRPCIRDEKKIDASLARFVRPYGTECIDMRCGVANPKVYSGR